MRIEMLSSMFITKYCSPQAVAGNIYVCETNRNEFMAFEVFCAERYHLEYHEMCKRKQNPPDLNANYIGNVIAFAISTLGRKRSAEQLYPAHQGIANDAVTMCVGIPTLLVLNVLWRFPQDVHASE